MRPRWVYVGRTSNLATTLEAVAQTPEIMEYEPAGGLFITWSLIRTELQEGVVAYLSEMLKPLVANPQRPPRGTQPIPVLVPAGMR